MSKLFRPKTMRRMVVFLAMIAPAVYLFGSLFNGLAGSNGQQVFAGENAEHVESFGVDSFSTGYYSHSDGSFVSDVRFWTTGIVSCDGVGSLSFGGSVTSHSQRVIACYDAERVFLSGSRAIGDDCLLSYTVDSCSFIAVSFYSRSVFEDLWSNPSVVFHYSDVSFAYSDYVFGQFFAKDNFLVQWGQNAISENPYGFAPFGYFWRYLDVNVLHLSNDQAGLMAYGYMYYASHVLLFDVGFILVTFFLTFIQKVADKIGGEEHA